MALYTEIGAFDAKTHFAALLRRAGAGEIIEITRYGKCVAELHPPRAENTEMSAWKELKTLKKAQTKKDTSPITTNEILEWVKESRHE